MSQPAPIDRAFFRRSPEGATVFFPWGLAHRGYVLPDAAARKRAARAVAAVCGATAALGTWVAHRLVPLVEAESASAGDVTKALAAPLAGLAVVLLAYTSWARRLAERFPASDLQVPREERLREAAHAVAPWQVTAIGIVVCILSALLAWLRPQTRWIALLGVVVGLGTACFGVVLQRHRSPVPP